MRVTIAELLGKIPAKAGAAIEPHFAARERVQQRNGAETHYRSRFPGDDDILASTADIAAAVACADGIAAGAPRLRSVLGRGIDAADECCGRGCARCPRTHEPPGGETRL